MPNSEIKIFGFGILLGALLTYLLLASTSILNENIKSSLYLRSDYQPSTKEYYIQPKINPIEGTMNID
jgi:hypothetical protein